MDTIAHYKKLLKKDQHLPFSIRPIVHIPKDVCRLCVFEWGGIHIKTGFHWVEKNE